MGELLFINSISNCIPGKTPETCPRGGSGYGLMPECIPNSLGDELSPQEEGMAV